MSTVSVSKISKAEWLLMAVGIIFLVIHIIILYTSKNKRLILQDVDKWLERLSKRENRFVGFIYLLVNYKAFRNLYYLRIGKIHYLINFLSPKLNSLHISVIQGVGTGLFIEHGESTYIYAKSIGKDCYINQQVTIGYSNKTDCPILMDNVHVKAGAKVIGNVVLGNNVIVGANAVVVKDVPDNCVVVGVPAYIVRRNGIKTKERL